MTYQWRRGSTDIAGATNATYTTSATVAGDNGAVFSVVVSNVAGSVTSSNAVLTVTTSAPPVSVAGHPRLWVRESDLARLRSWAVDSNPLWKDGLLPLAESARQKMDQHVVPNCDLGGTNDTDAECRSEEYAELFAFMSLVHPDASTRTDYGNRARTLLMHIINEAAKGVADGQPFRGTEFSVMDRSRWVGEAFGLTVDWIYPYLTSADKTAIRKVFLRWSAENSGEIAYIHPRPYGLLNDPALLTPGSGNDINGEPPQDNVKWSNNNYYNAHMRNLGLMAMAMDAADDPGNTLKNYLNNATGAYLYILDNAWRTVNRGGLLAEGFEYSPQSLGYQAQFLWALKTSGNDNTAVYGQQVAGTQPFWNDVAPAFLHSLSPKTSVQDVGQVYLPAWYGSAQDYRLPDMIRAFGPLTLRAVDAGNTDATRTYRWIQLNTPPGAADQSLAERIRRGEHLSGILYFLMFDPKASAPTDPRGSLGLQWVAEGTGRLLARTAWTDDAALFSFACGWKQIDHQTADALNFEFYRKGEWLTKHRIGYDLDYALVDNHNSLAIENSQPEHSSDYRRDVWTRGSQYILSPAAQAQMTRWSSGNGYVYALGDATGLYNSTYENVSDVTHASRSIVWLKPDHIVTYDRAETTVSGRFKRFWMQFPAQPAITKNVATVATPGGQKLFVTSLWPTDASLSAGANPNEASGGPANFETMAYRLRVEAPNNPARAEFLHVIQGADNTASASPATLVQSTSGTSYRGLTVAGTTIMFPTQLATPFTGTGYTATAGTRHLVTGLVPGATYSVNSVSNGGTVTISIAASTSSGALAADSGGVLVFSP